MAANTRSANIINNALNGFLVPENVGLDTKFKRFGGLGEGVGGCIRTVQHCTHLYSRLFHTEYKYVIFSSIYLCESEKAGRTPWNLWIRVYMYPYLLKYYAYGPLRTVTSG
jgi:hypothetical protein